jgi:hypothetical protein
MTSPQPNTGLVVRSPVAVRQGYNDYKHDLRFDFWYACGYCTMSEVEAKGIGFQIDHYIPQSEPSTNPNRYSNLIWACQPCNRDKGEFFPPELRAKGTRFFKADEDVFEEHFEPDGLRLKWKTTVGETTVETLRLNKLNLLRIRKIRADWATSKNQIAAGIRALSNLPLDSFPPKLRFKIEAIRNRAKRQQAALQDDERQLREGLKEVNRSQLLDPASDARESSRQRRHFLEGTGVIGPRLTAPQKKTR